MKKALHVTCFLIILTLVLNEKTFGQCNAKYATLPYTQGFETPWLILCGTDSIAPDSSWLNSSDSVLTTAQQPAWRRDDYNLWQNDGAYYTPVAAFGNYSARFHTANTNAGSYPASGNLDLHINCSQPGSKQLTFYYINEAGSDYMNVSVSTDSGATFTLLSQYTTDAGWTEDTLLLTSTSPKTIIRFTAASSYGSNGSDDIGLDSIAVSILASCNGKPTSGTIVQGGSCWLIGDSLYLSGQTTATGMSYSWQQSSDNINWSTVAGDTLSAEVFNPGTTTYYRAVAACKYSGLSDTASAVQVNGNASFYRAIPYSESFESWITKCAVSPNSLDVPDTGWTNVPPYGNNSWRRDDEGNTGDWIGEAGANNYVQTPYGNYSARFHAFNAQAGFTGTLNLYIDCSTYPGNKVLSFYYLNPESAGSDSLNVYVSEDGGITFSPSLINCPGGITSWTNFTVSISSTSPTTVISFVGTSDDGNNDMWLDNVQVGPSISTGMQAINKNPGTIDVYPDPFNGQFTLSLNGMPEGNFNVEISNTLGQTVMELTDYSSGSVYTKPVDMHTLPGGVYFVSVIINGNGYVKKAIKMD